MADDIRDASGVSDIVARPRSATGALTGLVGVIAALAAATLLRNWLEPVWLKSLATVALAAAAMLAVDLGIYRSHLNPGTGLSQPPLRPLDPVRVTQKLVGFWVTVGVIAFAYWLLPEYARDAYAPFKQAALWCLPALVALSPFYVAWIDRRQREPIDAYAQLSGLLAGHRPKDWSALRNHALGWLVKGFFLPLMFGFTTQSLAAMWSRPLLPDPFTFSAVFDRLIDLFYLLDVLLASIAYGLTLRLMDTQIRSVEPTLGGWVICLICYEPFVKGVGGTYLLYEGDKLYWGTAFGPYPWLYAAWGTTLLILVLVYVWSTAAFGLRFSNLTNRGIITNGPYRWLRHPAYVSKNLSWWMISVPFVASAGWSVALQSCLLLGAANLIYFLRAKTEERHLSQDPIYREYSAFMARHGLVAVVSRLWSRRATALA
ncbi:MAG TPA: isoprenylcysteine carboxylmethyltransferase family protein [Hyphomicrobiaceae bacterium]|nr:isoprenylcysteine carboxylmethyltransferase family protein [Hyphomicrobiaceae bacterium]